MVLPILLGAAAASAAVFGAKEGAEAVLNNTLARLIRFNSQADYDAALNELEQSKALTTSLLEILGKQKLNAWDQRLGSFVRLYSQLKNVELTHQAGMADYGVAEFSHEELAQMRQLSFQAHEVLIGGAAALGTGALAGIASYGGAMMFATASTGTAIGALSGAAATNATLAWFGGGSLASGGLGMAGGMMVLGGLMTAPILAVGGMVLNSKAEQNLAQARSDSAEAMRIVEEIQSALNVLNAVHEVAQVFQGMVARLGALLDEVLEELERVIQVAGTDYQIYNVEQRRWVYLSVQCAQVLKLVVETPLLTQAGGLQADCQQIIERVTSFEQQMMRPQAIGTATTHG